MKEITFELGEFIPYSNQGELVLGNPDEQPRQTVAGVFEVQKDKRALDAVRDELRNNPLLMAIFPIAVELQPSNHVEVTNNNQDSLKRELTIEEAIAMVLLSFVELAVGIFKAIDNKAKTYFLNQKGIFDGPGKRLLEKSLARRPNFHFLRRDIGGRSNNYPADGTTRAGMQGPLLLPHGRLYVMQREARYREKPTTRNMVSRVARSICMVKDALSATATFL